MNKVSDLSDAFPVTKFSSQNFNWLLMKVDQKRVSIRPLCIGKWHKVFYYEDKECGCTGLYHTISSYLNQRSKTS